MNSHTAYQVCRPDSSLLRTIKGAAALLEQHHACTDLVHHARHLVYEGGCHLAAHPGLGLAGIKIKKERTKTTKRNIVQNKDDETQRNSAELGRSSSGAVLGAGQNTSSHETGRMVSSVSEGNCDMLNDEIIQRINVCFPICRAISGGSLPVLLTTSNKQ